MKYIHDLRVRTRLAIAYVLFILPVAFLVYVIIAKTVVDVSFAEKELQGTRYVAALRQIQDIVLRGDTVLPNQQLAARVAAAEEAFGGDMGTAEMAKAATAALTAVSEQGNTAARGALRDLIGKVTDGSNLTLDPDLDSFYVMDAATGKIPEALDRFYGISVLTASFAGKTVLTPEEQSEFLVQLGSLSPVLDGLDASLGTAFKANDTVRDVLAEPLAAARSSTRTALSTLQTTMRDDRAGTARAALAVIPAMSALSSLGTLGATELTRLLEARVTGFRTSLAVNLISAASLFAAAIGFILFAIQWGVVSPLGHLTGLMRRLTSNDFDVEIPVHGRRDEIGDMAQVLAAFKQNAIENSRLTQANAREHAARATRQAAMDRHTQDFGTSVSGVMAILAQSAGAMRTAATAMSEAAKHTRDSASGAVEGARISSRDLNAVAVATEQMAASVHEIRRQVMHVTGAVQQAVERASRTDAKVSGLADAADRIGDVVRLINDIASQTNLLALNATIEAARAGDAGKGFAVVAGEVKVLAGQTARATDQIGAQVVAIRGATTDAVEAMREVSMAIGQVESVASAIAAAVEQQAAATQEISGSVQSVTAATVSVARSMEQVLTIAERTDVSSQSVLTTADEVGATADTLRVEVNDFLGAMANDDSNERRAYVRIAGDGTMAAVRVARGEKVTAPVKDISRGGVALAHDLTARAGTEVEIDLPGADGVQARIVRSENGVLTVAFRQDATNLGRVDKALEMIRQGRAAA